MHFICYTHLEIFFEFPLTTTKIANQVLKIDDFNCKTMMLFKEVQKKFFFERKTVKSW